MLNIMIYKQYKVEKSAMKVIEKSLNIFADIDIQLTYDVSKYARFRDSDSNDKLSFKSMIKNTSTACSTSSTSAQQACTSTVQT